MSTKVPPKLLFWMWKFKTSSWSIWAPSAPLMRTKWEAPNEKCQMRSAKWEKLIWNFWLSSPRAVFISPFVRGHQRVVGKSFSEFWTSSLKTLQLSLFSILEIRGSNGGRRSKLFHKLSSVNWIASSDFLNKRRLRSLKSSFSMSTQWQLPHVRHFPFSL